MNLPLIAGDIDDNLKEKDLKIVIFDMWPEIFGINNSNLQEHQKNISYIRRMVDTWNVFALIVAPKNQIQRDTNPRGLAHIDHDVDLVLRIASKPKIIGKKDTRIATHDAHTQTHNKWTSAQEMLLHVDMSRFSAPTQPISFHIRNDTQDAPYIEW